MFNRNSWITIKHVRCSVCFCFVLEPTICVIFTLYFFCNLFDGVCAAMQEYLRPKKIGIIIVLAKLICRLSAHNKYWQSIKKGLSGLEWPEQWIFTEALNAQFFGWYIISVLLSFIGFWRCSSRYLINF